MIRRVYRDFLLDKLSSGEIRWLLSRGLQYFLIHASSLVRRPLCGPILGTLVTNYRCNYRCNMCDLPERDREFRDKGLSEFDTTRMRDIIDDFARLGVSGIGFTGGEPLLRKDIFELLSHTKQRGMITHLNTNGSLLDDKAARRIIESGVDSLNISLDGARAATHDEIRGVGGAFDRAIGAIERTIAARTRAGSQIRVKTVAVISERNVAEVQDLVKLAKALKVDCVEFIPLQTFTTGSGKRNAADAAFLLKIDDTVNYLSGLDPKFIRVENSRAHLDLFRRSFDNAASSLRCYAGYTSLAVDCYGDVYPCVPWYNWCKPAGNIRDSDLVSFWRSREYNKVREEVWRCHDCSLNCQAELSILFNVIKR